jgi:putative ABC transport system substrate-binding protein
MRRREFIGLVGGVATAWPLIVRGQQAGKLPTIGFLSAGAASGSAPFVAAFVQRLKELGWTEGQSVAIEYRWAEGRNARMAEIAAEFVRLKVDVILAQGNAAAVAAQKATSVVPIVFPASADPVGTGLVASLAQPGGNVTGLSIQGTDTAGKRIGLLREVVPNLRRVAIMANAGNSSSILEMQEIEAAARASGLAVATIEIRRIEDIAAGFAGLKERTDALLITGDAFLTANRTSIAILAASSKLPTIHFLREFVEAGGLMSYGPSFSTMFRRAADMVDKILRGTKPGDIPVEQPTKFDLVVNLTTAKAIGLAFPPTVLSIADEVIE